MAMKPDYIDIDNDGNKTEPMKEAAKKPKKMMGGGMMLHFVSFWTHDLVSYLGIAIVVAGLILSYVGGLFTSGDSTPRKKAA